jgi:hypothetical protein
LFTVCCAAWVVCWTAAPTGLPASPAAATGAPVPDVPPPPPDVFESVLAVDFSSCADEDEAAEDEGLEAGVEEAAGDPPPGDVARPEADPPLWISPG